MTKRITNNERLSGTNRNTILKKERQDSITTVTEKENVIYNDKKNRIEENKTCTILKENEFDCFCLDPVQLGL